MTMKDVLPSGVVVADAVTTIGFGENSRPDVPKKDVAQLPNGDSLHPNPAPASPGPKFTPIGYTPGVSPADVVVMSAVSSFPAESIQMAMRSCPPPDQMN